MCGRPAFHRCSRCKKALYCSQTQDWCAGGAHRSECTSGGRQEAGRPDVKQSSLPQESVLGRLDVVGHEMIRNGGNGGRNTSILHENASHKTCLCRLRQARAEVRCHLARCFPTKYFWNPGGIHEAILRFVLKTRKTEKLSML